MEKCSICDTYIWNGIKNHKCKPKWFCFDADEFKKGETPTAEEFFSYGTPIFANYPNDAAIEYMKWKEQRWSDYLDEMDILVMDSKGNKIYKYLVEAETIREYSTNGEPEIFELKIDDTKDNPKLFDF